MSSGPTAYVILGYNRDSDVYDVLAYWHSDLSSARKIAYYMSTMELKSKYDGTPPHMTGSKLAKITVVLDIVRYRWFEVVHEDSGVRQYVLPCV